MVRTSGEFFIISLESTDFLLSFVPVYLFAVFGLSFIYFGILEWQEKLWIME
jgi:hypothetical protein